MDLRTERTKRSIANAYLELRRHKTIEKITVKELSDYTKMSEEEINDILSLSLDAVETGTGELKMEESVTPKGNSIIDWNKM